MLPKFVSSPLPSLPGITPINVITVLHVLKFFVLWGAISSGFPLSISLVPSAVQLKSLPPFPTLFQAQFAPWRFWVSFPQPVPVAWLHWGEIQNSSLGWSDALSLRLDVPHGQYPSVLTLLQPRLRGAAQEDSSSAAVVTGAARRPVRGGGESQGHIPHVLGS